jgi:AcrR family transcriptional regulator
MPRPGKNIEEQLLRSGRVLYPGSGCAALTVRALTEHAGVNLAMFHYHFRSKDDYLRRLLGAWYEELYAPLREVASAAGTPRQRLGAALFSFAVFVREHRAVLGRVALDAASGHGVAVAFLRENAPRHLHLLLSLMEQGEREGALAPMAPLQRFIFVASGVATPLLIGPGMHALGVAPQVLGAGLQDQVMGDDAIRQRIALALDAISTPHGRGGR